ncbi:DUF5994 family protein [Mycobacterium sp.]|uniref:DUF5994 family protein n=1 Tax=Mycobacterium sp. TaxID=1785 RepID=UPI0026370371|nr:DUF5994 family protein [Mycobacterium sp.]
MTLEHTHRRFRQHDTSRVRTRLQLKPQAPRIGHVDGAWWPRSDDLPAELPDLIEMLSSRLGEIDCVTYNFNEWTETPAHFTAGERTVRLDGRHRQPSNTLEVRGADRSKIVLLVVPWYTAPDHAHAIVMSAAEPNDTSSLDSLLMISERDRERATRAAAAQGRWESQGRSKRSTSRNRQRFQAISRDGPV